MSVMSYQSLLNVNYDDKFLTRIEKLDNGCWYWVGKRGNSSKKHYGVITHKGESVNSHRYSWMYHNKSEIADSLFVCHTCDNKPCVNPDHLFLGTHEENMADAKVKGIMASGEKASRTKLSSDNVTEIIKLFNEGKSVKYISEKFGVYNNNIRHILSGRTWTHLTKDIKVRSTARVRISPILEVGKTYFSLYNQPRTIVKIEGENIFYIKPNEQKTYKCRKHTFEYFSQQVLDQLKE